MKKKLVLSFLVLLVFIALLIFFFPKPLGNNKYFEPTPDVIQIELEPSLFIAMYSEFPEELANDDIVILEVSATRACIRDRLRKKYGTYYTYAKAYWKKSEKPFKCKYIRIEHNIYGSKRLKNVSRIGFTPQQSRHCKAHHLKAYFNVRGYGEQLVEKGQQ